MEHCDTRTRTMLSANRTRRPPRSERWSTTLLPCFLKVSVRARMMPSRCNLKRGAWAHTLDERWLFLLVPPRPLQVHTTRLPSCCWRSWQTEAVLFVRFDYAADAIGARSSRDSQPTCPRGTALKRCCRRPCCRYCLHR